MNKKLLIIPALAMWLIVPALGAHILFGQSPVAHQIRANGKVHAQYASTTQGSIGSAREVAVLAATKRYVAAHPDAPLDACPWRPVIAFPPYRILYFSTIQGTLIKQRY